MTPLRDSKCHTEQTLEGWKVSWSRRVKSPFRWLASAFVCFWLCGWFFGFVSAVTQVLKGDTGGGFLIVWLGGWTIGGLFASYMLYSLNRPAIEESVLVSRGRLVHDSGTPDILEFWPNSRMLMQGRSSWQMFTRKRRAYDLGGAELATLKLDGEGDRQRLRYDFGAERVEIGSVLTEPEREWLFNEITKAL